jgi:AbrB family looped-hinge helix DNA binding protein
MKHATKTTIDASGRLVIPKPIRQQAGFQPGQPLEVTYRDGHVEIEPAPMPVRIERKGRVAVAVPEQPVPTLSGEVVERVRRELRER